MDNVNDNSTVQQVVPETTQGFVPTPGTPESSTPTSGYYTQKVDEQYRAEPEPTDNGYDINDLASKLGVDPNSLGVPEEPKVEPPLSTEDWYSKQFSTEEAKQFAANFQKHFGMDIKQVYEVINQTAQVTQGLEQWRKQVSVQQQTQQLRTELGNDYDSLMPLVGQRFQEIRKVNPKQAEALDNIDGARMLAALIRQEQGQQKYTGQNTNVPTYLPNRRPVNRGNDNSSPVIKMSDFLNWTDDEVQRRMPDIYRAKQNGTFIHDI
jgi:hypothetical protein